MTEAEFLRANLPMHNLIETVSWRVRLSPSRASAVTSSEGEPLGGLVDWGTAISLQFDRVPATMQVRTGYPKMRWNL
jgi:hypothetical protein